MAAWPLVGIRRGCAILTAVDPYLLQRYLRPGERLLWSGCPDPAATFTPADAFLIPFSVMWGGFAVFWEVGVSAGGPNFGTIWGLPFVAIGLYFIFGRFFYKRYRKRRTCYGITDQRALVTVGSGQMSDSPLRDQPVSPATTPTPGWNCWPGTAFFRSPSMTWWTRTQCLLPSTKRAAQTRQISQRKTLGHEEDRVACPGAQIWGLGAADGARVMGMRAGLPGC